MKELIEKNFVYIACNFSLYKWFELRYLWAYFSGYNNTYILMNRLYKLFKLKHGDKIYRFEKWVKRKQRLEEFPYYYVLHI